MSLYKYVLLCFLAIVICSCSKEAGVGGKATIQGKLYVLDYNLNGELKDEYYGPDEDVFIVYGDAAFYGDKVKTHYDGTFQFPFLNEGSYQIYAYSRCDTCASEVEAKIIDVEITNGDDLIILDDLVINK